MILPLKGGAIISHRHDGTGMEGMEGMEMERGDASDAGAGGDELFRCPRVR